MDIMAISGGNCATVYKKENQTKFRDCLTFYIDGRVLFERYCYGEAAGLVFDCIASGIDENGNILWTHEPDSQSRKEALPRVIEDFTGDAIKIAGDTKRYIKEKELLKDSARGYSKFKLWLVKRKLRNIT